MFSTDAKNAMLTRIGSLALFCSLHSAYSAAGANELAGGSPAYGRKANSWSVASGAFMVFAGQPQFDVPSGSIVAFIGFQGSGTGAGPFYGMTPLGGDGYKEIQVDAAGNRVVSEAHGLGNGNKVCFLGGSPPAPLVEGTVYFVTSAATDDFAVAATSGGAAIDLTTDGDANVRVSRIGPEEYASQGTLTVQSLSAFLF